MELITKEAAIALSKKRLTVAFYLQDRVEVLDFAGPMEILSYGGFDIFTVSKTKDPINAQGILTIIPDYSIDDAPKADILAFFGGNAASATNDPELIEWVKKQQDVQYYFSVCTGAFILAEAGILADKTATTFHSALNSLEKNYPDTKVLKGVRYVDNGNTITTAGISAGIDGALHLVAKIHGLKKAKEVAFHTEYDKWIPGEGLHLTKEDIYESDSSQEVFQAFVGTFTNEGRPTAEIVFNAHHNGIELKYKGQKTPLLQIAKDVFKDAAGNFFTFQREASGSISSYYHSGSARIWKKTIK
ncbi:MAG: DJ-1/PfpI family protein [Bacteroidota bacterium]